MLNEALAAVDLLGPVGIDVEAEHPVLTLHRRERQRNTDIAEADHSDERRAGTDRIHQHGGLVHMMRHVQRLSYYGFWSAISGDHALLTRVSAPIN